MALPKLLHFTWKTEDVPGRMGRYLDLWRALHPGWQIKLWTDATMRDFVAAEYPDFLATYDAYPRMIQRADSFRYLVLNALGGVYSDLDVEPIRAIDPLAESLDCFAGIEPDEHMGAHRRHSGVPFLITNAFFGAAPGHPFFAAIVAHLGAVADIADVFISTGPSLTTGTALKLPRAQRPALLPPSLWSPRTGDGGKAKSDDRVFALASPGFDFAFFDRKPFVSHEWATSWQPWTMRHRWLAAPFKPLHAAKWAWRRLVRRDLARVRIADPLCAYLDQVPRPPLTLPRIAIGVSEGEAGLQRVLDRLDYPRELLRVLPGVAQSPMQAASGLSPAHRAMAAQARQHNGLIDATLKTEAEYVLFLDGAVIDLPADALVAMLGADKPVVALGGRDARGAEADFGVFRYHNGGGIRTVYKIRDVDGIADAGRGQREYLSGLGAFAQIPLDGVGKTCVLVRRDVLEAGVRFAEAPYHLHLDGEGFALMARHRGFEVAGLTGFAARVAK